MDYLDPAFWKRLDWESTYFMQDSSGLEKSQSDEYDRDRHETNMSSSDYFRMVYDIGYVSEHASTKQQDGHDVEPIPSVQNVAFEHLSFTTHIALFTYEIHLVFMQRMADSFVLVQLFNALLPNHFEITRRKEHFAELEQNEQDHAEYADDKQENAPTVVGKLVNVLLIPRYYIAQQVPSDDVDNGENYIDPRFVSAVRAPFVFDKLNHDGMNNQIEILCLNYVTKLLFANKSSEW